MSLLTGRQSDWIVRGAGVGVLLFLWIPLLAMMLLSFGNNPFASFPMNGLTLKWYEQAIASGDIWMSVLNTVVVASLTAVVATVIGLLGAFAIVRREFPFKGPFRVAAILPMIIPGIVLGMALLILFRLIAPWSLSLGTVIIAHALYTMPFSLLTISARLYSFEETMEEAGRDLGASRTTVLRTITLPQLSSAIIAGGLLAFIRSFSEFIRAYFVFGGRPVFTIRIWAMLNHGLSPRINAISTIVMVGMVVVLLVAYWIGKGDFADELFG